MPEDWTLRRATLADLPALTMLSATNRMHHARLDASVRQGDLATRRDRYTALLGADNTLVLLAEEATPIACFAAIFYPPGPDTPARAYIEDAFVMRRWRRHGVLTAMVETLLSECRRREILQVEVDYMADNPEGVAAWTRLGFAPRSVRATAEVARLGGKGHPRT